MIYAIHEKHEPGDPLLPMIFNHQRYSCAMNGADGIHWHENMELLYITRGSGRVRCGLEVVEARVGDLVVVNSNELHSFELDAGGMDYYCLIPDWSICEEFGLMLRNVSFAHCLRGNPFIGAWFTELENEISLQSFAYKSAAKILILRLMLYLARHQPMAAEPAQSELNVETAQSRLVKATLHYMQTHYREDISADDLCRNAGFSKCYFCRTFRQVAGLTVTEYLNRFRCQQAQKLLRSGKYTVQEAAEETGFHTLSYFYRVYKRYMDHQPSQDLPEEPACSALIQ